MSAVYKHSLAGRINGGASLLFTSPPYYGVTNYFYDQWLRLWLLGYLAKPQANNGKHRNRFADRESYKALLRSAVSKASKLPAVAAVVYGSTDGRKFTHTATTEVLGEVFSGKKIRSRRRPSSEVNQTQLFANTPSDQGEVDLIVQT